jgi:membrane protease YdiL (CAAX protease family)
MLYRALDWLFFRHWRHIEHEARAELAAESVAAAGKRAGDAEVDTDTGKKGKKGKSKGERARDALAAPIPDATAFYRPLIILVTVAISLTLQEYIGDRATFYRLFPRGEMDIKDWQLMSFAWWSGWRFLGYVVLPMLTIYPMKWWFGGPGLRGYYVSFKGFFKHLWIYALLFGLILPAVIAASKQQSFYQTYPFFKWANQSTYYFISWELLYALQFVSLEFFFRGYMLSGLKPRFGTSAIFLMIVPYCMIHYGKPMPETLGAIGAGIILGTLAMRTRSIWGGVLIHIAVAWTMDYLALGECPPADSGRPCSGH